MIGWLKRVFVWYGVGDQFGICVVDTDVAVKIGGLVPGRVVEDPVVIGARAVNLI